MTKVLVLGNSDTRGEFAPGPTWTAVAQARLNADSPEYEFAERGFTPLGEGMPAFIERVLAQHEPDLVVLPLGTFLFTVGFSWPRIRKLFGARAANRYRQAEEQFDTKTRPAGAPPGRANSAARKTARRLVGTQPIMSRAALEASYGRVLDVLARHEDLDVLLVAYPAERGRLVKVRKIAAERQAFVDAIGALAARRHFRLLDSAPLFAGREDDDDIMTADGFHLQGAGHVVLGEAVAGVIGGAWTRHGG